MVDDTVPAAGSNYSTASRGAADIDWIVVHATAGSYQSALHVFQDPSYDASAHYVVRNSDGRITQMVDDSDVAWHAGNGEYNARSIGIEFENADTQLEDDFSEALYESGGELVAHLASEYDIPLERVTGDVGPCSAYDGAGLIEHAQVPDPNDCSAGGGISRHWDPGPNWDWGSLMRNAGGDDPEEDDEGSVDPTTGSIDVGSTVVATTDLNVRSSASLGDNVGFTVSEGSTGTITDGPYEGDGYTWWHVDWDDYSVGWSVGTYLESTGSDGGSEGSGSTGGDDGTFGVGAAVAATADLNVRSWAGIGDNVGFSVADGSTGTVTDGPYEGDGYTWWHVDWDDYSVGWSVEAYLEVVGS